MSRPLPPTYLEAIMRLFKRRRRFSADEIIEPGIFKMAVSTVRQFETNMKELQRICAVSKNEGAYIPRTPQYSPTIPRRPRNLIHPDMAERKFKQPNQNTTGVRTWVVFLLLSAFLLTIIFL